MVDQRRFKNPTRKPQELEAYRKVLKNLPTLDLQALCERRFNRGYACPRCGSTHLHGHGRYRERRRFRCVDCGRTFNELTMTPLHGTHYPEKWLAYVCCLHWGLSLRKAARLVGISLPTAFAWRHKLLTALRHGAAPSTLDGIVEMDEVYVLESEKGNRHLDRPPRRRGTRRSMSRWLAHHDRACVMVARDRRDGVFTTVLGMGQPTVFDVEEALSAVQFSATVICTDNRQAYWSFSVRNKVPRELFQRPWQRKDLRHMGHVNRYLTYLENWMTRFNGVATRYLPNYVHWFGYVHEAARWAASPEAVSEIWGLRSVDARVRTTSRCPFRR